MSTVADHTPSESKRPTRECSDDNCENEFKIYPENMNQKYCSHHQFQKIKQEVENQ